MVEGVRRGGIGTTSTGTAQFSYSRDGALVYLPGHAALSITDSLDLALFDRKGVAQPLKLKPGSYRSPRVSPDGKLVAFDTEDEKEAVVWIYELSAGRAMQRLTFGGKNRHPIWSRDGKWVAFQSDREGDLAIFRQPADGSGTAERLTKPEAGGEHVPYSWSPGDGHLLFGVGKDKQWTLWTMAMNDRRLAPFGDVRSNVRGEGVFAPDGRWIAYQEGNEVERQVFVQPFPATGAKYLVRQGGHPLWSANGDTLTLNVAPSVSARIPFTTAPRVAFGQSEDFPRAGRAEGSPASSRRNADSMPDGEHIIGVYTGSRGEAEAAQIQVVLNWFDEVRQRAPRK